MKNSRTKNSFILIIAKLSNILIALGISATLSRVIENKSLYGALQQILMMYSMLSVIFAAGIPQSGFYFLPRCEGGERKGLLLQNIVLLFLQGLVLGLLLFNLRNWLGNTFNSQYLPRLLQVFAIYPILMLPTLAVQGILITYNRVSTFMIFSIFSRVLTYLSLVVPVILGFSLENAIIIWDVAAFIILIVALELIFSPVWKEKMVWNYHMLKKELKYSLPLALAAMLSSIIVFTDKIVISKILGATVYAIYANGAIELPLIGAITGSVQSILMADFSLKSKSGLYDEIIKVWHRAIFKTSMILIPFCGFLFFWAHDFIILLYSQKYEASYEIFRIYIWMTPVRIFAFSTILLPIGATLLLTEINIVNAFIAIITIPVWAHYFGINGAAFGAIVVYWFIFFYGILRSSHKIKIRFGYFLPWKKLFILLTATVILGGISKVIETRINVSNYVDKPEIVSFANLSFGAIIFILLYMIFLEKMKYFSFINFSKQSFNKFGFITHSS